MNDIQPRPKGRSMSELRRIIKADQERWEALAEVWNDLTTSEQFHLLKEAKRMAERHN